MKELWDRVARAPMGFGFGFGFGRKKQEGLTGAAPTPSEWTWDSETVTLDSELHTMDGSAP